MGSVGKIRMIPDCLPSKFQCQQYRIKLIAPPKRRSAIRKRQRIEDVTQQIVCELPIMSSISFISLSIIFSNESDKTSSQTCFKLIGNNASSLFTTDLRVTCIAI